MTPVSARGRFPRTLVRMKALSLAAACCAAIAFPASAAAVKCVPPGVSGVTQYYETIPGSSCSQSPPAGGGHGHGGSLPGGTGKQLSKQGGAGQAVAQLVASTGTAHQSGRAGQRRPRSSGGTLPLQQSASAPRATPNNVISALVHPIVSGAGGAGILLPLVLAIALLAALAIAISRRRRTAG
jgi:hypothetical protein